MWIRDLWRGWSDDDLKAVRRKIEEHDFASGFSIPVTPREMRAYKSYKRRLPALILPLPCMDGQ